MRGWRIGYWFVTGTVLGVGLAALPSIGIILLPVGMVLVVVGALRVGARGLWALAVGFGALPAALVTWTIVSAPPPCPANGALAARTGQVMSCSGPIPTTYYVLAAGFGVIALAGIVWGVVQGRARRRA